MAKAEHIKALIRSHGDSDDERFYAIAMQLAAQEARAGHTRFAKELREVVDAAKVQGKQRGTAHRPIPIVQPRGELAGLLAVEYPKLRLADMVLDPDIEQRLARVLIEQRQRERIREHGYQPMRKLLLVGPPGTGKTMTASCLAGELGLPCFTIQLHGLITKYMGETAAKLRVIFDGIRATRGVYLFDEFDALGGERGARNDVGEIRRVLNSFLLFLEQESSDSLVVCATNHLEILDRALFRRFDTVIEFKLPERAVALRVMQARLAALDTSGVNWASAGKACRRLSHAEIARACEHAAKEAILAHSTTIETDVLVKTLKERHTTAQDDTARRRAK